MPKLAAGRSVGALLVGREQAQGRRILQAEVAKEVMIVTAMQSALIIPMATI